MSRLTTCVRQQLPRPSCVHGVAGAFAVGLVVALSALPASAQQGWEPVVAAVDARSIVPVVVVKPVTLRPLAAQVPSAAERAPVAPAHVVAQAARPAVAEPASAQGAVQAIPIEAGAARQYCVSITNAAADARLAWQKRTLAGIEQEIDNRVALLEAKTAELQKWVTRRDEFVKKARDNLVSIYARMRPDAAAMQLVAMEEETAAAVLLKLEANIASKILNEMEPAQAARLTAIIGGAARTAPAKVSRSGPAEERRP